jgi:hypothetical protein
MIKIARLVNQIALDSLFRLSRVSLGINMTNIIYSPSNITLVNLPRLYMTIIVIDIFPFPSSSMTLLNPQS